MLFDDSLHWIQAAVFSLFLFSLHKLDRFAALWMQRWWCWSYSSEQSKDKRTVLCSCFFVVFVFNRVGLSENSWEEFG